MNYKEYEKNLVKKINELSHKSPFETTKKDLVSYSYNISKYKRFIGQKGFKGKSNTELYKMAQIEMR